MYDSFNKNNCSLLLIAATFYMHDNRFKNVAIVKITLFRRMLYWQVIMGAFQVKPRLRNVPTERKKPAHSFSTPKLVPKERFVVRPKKNSSGVS